MPSFHPGRCRPAIPGWQNIMVLALLCTSLGMVGCRSSSGLSGRGTDGEIRSIHLMSLPIGLNLDQQGGSDGFSVRVYASTVKDPKTQPIREGSLEVMMFDGTVAPQAATTNTPLRSWTFSAEQLPQYRNESAIGTLYAFTLAWGETAPTNATISVAARYRPAQGQSLVTPLNTIAVASQ